MSLIIIVFSSNGIDMDFDYELDATILSSLDPEMYKSLERVLLLSKIRKPGYIPRDLAYPYSNQFQSREDNKWIKQRKRSEPLHPILALYMGRNPNREKSIKSRNHPEQTLMQKKGSMVGRYYPRNVMKMAKKSPAKRIFHHEDFSNLAKGHEHQE